MKKEYDLNKLKPRGGGAKASGSASKVPINIRLDGFVLAALKTLASRKRLPYQTLIGSVLFQYVDGQLVEKKVRRLKLLKRVA